MLFRLILQLDELLLLLVVQHELIDSAEVAVLVVLDGLDDLRLGKALVAHFELQDLGDDIHVDFEVGAESVGLVDDVERQVDKEPRVVFDLVDFDALDGVGLEHAVDQILHLRRDEVGHVVLALLYRFVQLRKVLVVERQRAAHHRVQDHAARPDVHLASRVALARNYLRSGVVRRTTGRSQRDAVLQVIRQSEVYDLYVLVLVHQQILRLKVSVRHFELLDVLKS